MNNKNSLFILAGNGPYQNRGCEAIVRGTVKILREHFGNPGFICHSHFQSEHQFKNQCVGETDEAITHLASRKLDKKEVVSNLWKPQIWKGLYQYYFSKNSIYSWTYQDMLRYIDDADAVLSVGGDNYSLDYGIPKTFTGLDDVVIDGGKPMIIWGASVGPFDKIPEYERYMSDHLKKITGIFARESATIEYLKKIGVAGNVHSVADPAFLMDPVKPEGIEESLPIDKDAIGINLSPLIAKYVTEGDIEQWSKIAATIIESIAKKTDMPVYLIPHVTVEGSNDYLFLQKASTHFRVNTKNICVVPPIYNASEIKWIISKMAIFAGARTHSTIAALSSKVPTLSFAYSIKAQGINRDIFGHTKYCLNPGELKGDSVSSHIISMLDHDVEIKSELNKQIPAIQRSASNAGSILKQTLKR